MLEIYHFGKFSNFQKTLKISVKIINVGKFRKSIVIPKKYFPRNFTKRKNVEFVTTPETKVLTFVSVVLYMFFRSLCSHLVLICISVNNDLRFFFSNEKMLV